MINILKSFATTLKLLCFVLISEFILGMYKQTNKQTNGQIVFGPLVWRLPCRWGSVIRRGGLTVTMDSRRRRPVAVTGLGLTAQYQIFFQFQVPIHPIMSLLNLEISIEREGSKYSKHHFCPTGLLLVPSNQTSAMTFHPSQPTSRPGQTRSRPARRPGPPTAQWSVTSTQWPSINTSHVHISTLRPSTPSHPVAEPVAEPVPVQYTVSVSSLISSVRQISLALSPFEGAPPNCNKD